MKKKTQKILLISGISILVLLLLGIGFYFFVLNAIIGTTPAAYSTISSTPEILTYSNPIGPDYNRLTTDHIFKQWNTGNVGTFNSFSKNPQLVQFYLRQGLNINPNDFSTLPMDGDCLPSNKVLKVNYCKVPTEPNVVKTTVDSDGCQHYQILSSTKTANCVCDKCGAKYCYPPNTALGNTAAASDVLSPYSGCAYSVGGSQVRDCSSYSTSVVQEDFGGTIDGQPRGYKAIFDSNGWTLSQEGYIAFGNDVIRCTEYSYIFDWTGAVSDSVMNTLADSLVCEAKGTYSSCKNNGVNCISQGNYDIIGKVTWEGASGFDCHLENLPNVASGYDDNRISGTIEFKKPIDVTVYNLDSINKVCNSVVKSQMLINSTDYLIKTECESKITYTSEEYTDQQNLLRSLNMSYQERAALIQSLNLTLNEQISLIKDLNLKVEENVLLIESLNLNIAQQAQIVNELTSNLAEKAFYVSQLQAENENQAALIAQMQESFANQGTIIENLHLTIEEDASLIKNLNLTTQQEAEIIKNLNLNLEEQAGIINNLKLTNDKQAEMISILTTNIQEQQDIVNKLNLTQSEKDTLLSSLQIENNKLKKSNTILIWSIIGISLITLIAIITIIFLVRRRK